MRKMIDYSDPKLALGMQVRWSEHEAECIENALDGSCETIGHAQRVCAHVRDLIQNAAPSPVPLAAASILHMTFLALEATANRECEFLSEAEQRIRTWRKKAIEEREWEEAEGARARSKKLQEGKENPE